MSLSQKRSRAHFNDDQDEKSDLNLSRYPKVKNGRGLNSKNLTSAESSKSGTTGRSIFEAVTTPETRIKKRRRRDKDIYDISSSDPEESRRPHKKKIGALNSFGKASSTPNLLRDDTQILTKSTGPTTCTKSKRLLGKDLKTSRLSGEKLNSMNTVKNECKSSVTPHPTGKTTVLVEIPSSGRTNPSGRSKGKKEIIKSVGRAEEAETWENHFESGRQTLSPRKQEKRSKELRSTIRNKPDKSDTNFQKELHCTSVSKSSKQRSKIQPSKLLEVLNHGPDVTYNLSKIKLLNTKENVATEAIGNIDLGFKDLPTAIIKKKQAAISKESKNPVGLTEVEGQDTACEVCGGYDSRKKNPMLLCDGCDYGYHIKCIGLSKEPESDQWFCQNCRSIVSYTRDGLAPLESSDKLPDISNFELHLKTQQRRVLDKLSGRTPLKLKGLQSEVQTVSQVIQQTVLAGQGNSMLIIGSRGTGKTTLVNYVISEISAHHRDSFHIIRLNGLIHTDDKLALKEIWRQMGREMQVEDNSTGKPINHADMLVSLLALLSDPSELSSQAESNETPKSVIFILDEFDHFTTHYRQTLLYNLFDIAQSKKAPILVLGLTTKIDVIERLEKRVKSRFSHRYIHLSLPPSLPAFWDICKEGLTADEFNQNNESENSPIPGYQDFLLFWQAMIADLYTKDLAFMQHIQTVFYQTKSVAYFLNTCILPIASLSLRNPLLRGEIFIVFEGRREIISLSEPDSKLYLLCGLSELELALLIAAARLSIILDTDTCNFEMVYEEYSILSSRHKIQSSSSGLAAIGAGLAKVWGRSVALDAWEKLARYELLIPVTTLTGDGTFGSAGRKWKVDVGLEEIPGSVEGLSGVMTKWCKEI